MDRMRTTPQTWLAALALLAFSSLALAQMAGAPTSDPLVIVQQGRPVATVVVASAAGENEKAAAADLVKYVEMMSGAKLPVVQWQRGAARLSGPAIFIGQAALAQDFSLERRLRASVKKDPVVNADAIIERRDGNHLYLAGNNDRAHYFAVSRLLQDWGCRWYMPTEFGEVVPEHADLTVGTLDHAYGSPFEIRSYWLSWLGDNTGREEFQRRNFANATNLPIFGHALGAYTKALIPQGKTAFNVPLAEPATAEEVTRQVEAQYAKGVPGISLAIEDGIYTSDSPADRALQSNILDKYMLAPVNTDAMITLYNNVARILQAKYPNSPTKIGGLAYSNVTLPPQRITQIESNIVMWLAPIDIDPNHGMDDPLSPPKQEYKSIMQRWAQLLHGRLAIYDYDQGQLVWRDMPDPSQYAFAEDVKHYRDAGILGVNTESRGATATTFLNLYFRLQLLWNPDFDVDAALAEFYPNFYGPAAAPMADYWNAIFAAWKNTISTEHEYFMAPAVYTPALVEHLRSSLAAAERSLMPLRGKKALTRNERQYLERMRFTELSFAVIDNYMAMVRFAATDAEYGKAAEAGARALQAREELTAMNPTFTAYKKIGENGYAWMPGEVEQMRELAYRQGGANGHLLTEAPLAWAFRRDPHDTGIARGWAYTPADLSYWKQHGGEYTLYTRKDYPDEWEILDTDLYMQGQGIRHPDGQSFSGYYWYQTDLNVPSAAKTSNVHLMFPGLFNQCWLYVNGVLVAHRPYREPWWRDDYRMEWDVDLSGKLHPGHNLVTLRGVTFHHFGGMFRRPFLYEPVAARQ
jgi:hypothetical protein